MGNDSNPVIECTFCGKAAPQDSKFKVIGKKPVCPDCIAQIRDIGSTQPAPAAVVVTTQAAPTQVATPSPAQAPIATTTTTTTTAVPTKKKRGRPAKVEGEAKEEKK